jgi:hypothetical protein
VGGFEIVDNTMETAERVRTERGLAATLAADVAGYSRLIGADEEERTTNSRRSSMS